MQLDEAPGRSAALRSSSRAPWRPEHPDLVGFEGDFATIDVTAERWSELRDLATVAIDLARTTRLAVTVESWSPPASGWMGRLGRIPALRRSLIERTEHGIVIEVDLDEPCGVSELLLAVLPVLVPHRAPTGSTTPDIQLRPVGGRPGPWAFPWASTLATSRDLLNPRIRTSDAVITTVNDIAAIEAADGVRLLSNGGSTITEILADGRLGHIDAPVDPLIHQPVGREAPETAPLTATLRAGDADTWTLVLPDGSTRNVSFGIKQHDVAALASIAHIDASGITSLTRRAQSILTQLSAIGIVVRTGPHGAHGGVSADLSTLWQQAPTGDAELLDRTVASVEQRRYVHRHLSVPAVLGGLLADVTSSGAAPTISLVLMTMRPDRVGFMLDQIADFDYPSIQVLIGLHADDAPDDEVEDEAKRRGLDAVVMGISTSVSFGAALGRLSERADGDLLTKLDDDDYYGPQHLWDLVVAHRYSGAQLVGKVAEYLYLAPLDLTVRRRGMPHERYAPVIAGGTMLISRADLDAVGGWRPVKRSVDLGLIERIQRDGGLVYRTHGLGYLYVRDGGGHTWDPGFGYFLRNNDQQWRGLLRHPEFGTAHVVTA